MGRDVQEEIQTIKKVPPSEEGGSGKDGVKIIRSERPA